jgi:FAD/FMN-containing dehydrogenase
MNLLVPPFDDVHVRRAVNYVIDKQGMAEHPTNRRAHRYGNHRHLAPCLQDAAPPAGCSVLGAAPVRRCDLTKWAVEERLPLVARGSGHPAGGVQVRPGLADAVICMS